MTMLYLVSIVLSISFVYSADYCAWNRAANPINDNNAETYNFINGEYNRDQTQSSGGQTALWQGMPYYKSTNPDSCYVTTLWMYRYTDIQVYPPVHTWVISPALGVIPQYAYAYCGPDEAPMISDLTSPLLCDGKWKIDNKTDIFFGVMPGGCPQVNCDQIKFCTNNNETWGMGERIDGGYMCGTYDYNNQPNLYIADNNNSATGHYHLFFNPRVWRWAVSESITYPLDPDDCELYKKDTEFSAVANVNGGDYDDPDIYTPWYLSAPSADAPFIWTDDTTSLATRSLICIGMYHIIHIWSDILAHNDKYIYWM